MKKIVILLLVFAPLVTFGQFISRKLANEAYKNEWYDQAVEHYNRLLKSNPEDREARIKIADSYVKLRDSKNAMEHFSILANEPDATVKILWDYAQVLAQEKMYEESVYWYERILEIEPFNEGAKKFIEFYKTVDFNESLHQVKYLHAVNSWQTDFAPVLYKGGLLFCSGRTKQHVVRNTFGYDNSAFLKWYFVNDTSSIKNDVNTEIDKTKYYVSRDKHHNDDYTRYTSNDGAIPASYGKTFLFDSLKYNCSSKVKVEQIAADQNKSHLGPITIHPFENMLVFTANDPKTGYLVLYSAKIENDFSFNNIKKLDFNVAGFSSGQPVFSKDGKQLYFTSNRPGGSGGTDIYFVNYDNGYFGQSINLESVNTCGDESFPFIDETGNLYFSSNFHPGYGGLDIFFAELRDTKAISIKNIGLPINSNKDDFGIVSTRNGEGYFSSNRKRGLTDDDIYHFKKNCNKITIQVVDNKTNSPIPGANIEVKGETYVSDIDGMATICLKEIGNIFGLNAIGYESVSYQSYNRDNTFLMKEKEFSITGRVLKNETGEPQGDVDLLLFNHTTRESFRYLTKDDGEYHFSLEPNSEYQLITSRNSCGTDTLNISTVGLSKSKQFKMDIVVYCVGDVITMDNIYYDLDDASIRADASLELDKLVDLLNRYPDMRIELRSHTDNRGSSEYNLSLSTQRAQSVVAYLEQQGIQKYRLRAIGFGESQPINDCKDGVECSEYFYQQNRRTEFRILEISVPVDHLAENRKSHQ